MYFDILMKVQNRDNFVQILRNTYITKINKSYYENTDFK